MTASDDVPYIGWTEDEDAEGKLGELIRFWKEKNPGRDRFPGILKCFSARPDFLEQVMTFSYGLHFSDGHLDRRTKEMIATYVSAINSCDY